MSVDSFLTANDETLIADLKNGNNEFFSDQSICDAKI